MTMTHSIEPFNLIVTTILLHHTKLHHNIVYCQCVLKHNLYILFKLSINLLLLDFNLLIFSTASLLQTNSNFSSLISDIYWILGWVLLLFNIFDLLSVIKFLMVKLCNKFYYFKSTSQQTNVYETNHELLIWNSLM